MIRTHRSGGHAFSCASHFQGSKHYRDLSYEDISATKEDILVSDSEDDLVQSERASKRRRVQALAEKFVDGRPVYPQSVISDAASSWAAIRRTLRERKQPWPCDLDDVSTDVIWEDVEDEWDYLRNNLSRHSDVPNKMHTLKPQSTHSDMLHDHDHELSVDHVILLPSTRKAGSVRKPPRTEPSPWPSSPAMRQAAALRHGRTHLTAPRTMDTISERTELTSVLFSSQRVNNLQATTEKRTKYQATLDFMHGPNSTSSFRAPATPLDDTMADELRCSRPESTSRKPTVFQHQYTSFTDSSTAETIGGTTQFYSLSGKEEQAAEDALSNSQRERQSISDAMDRHVASRHLPRSLRQDHSSEQIDHIAGTNDEGIRRRTLCASEHEHAPAQTSAQKTSTQRSTPRQQVPLTSSFSIRKPLQEPVPNAKEFEQESSDIREGPERIVSLAPEHTSLPVQTGRQRRQRRSTGVQPDQSKDIPVKTIQDDLTPFKYRRRNGKRANRTKRQSPSPKEPEKVTSHQTTDIIQHQPETLRDEISPSVEKFPSELNLPTSKDNMSLSEAHLNKIWPSIPTTGEGSLLIKEAICKEMEENGAEISRIDDIFSPKLGKTHGPKEAQQNCGEHHEVSPARHLTTSTGHTLSPQWPGTQALLREAQRDLLDSPQKTPAKPASRGGITSTGPDVQSDLSWSEAENGSNDQTVQQEALPGTQALIEQWSPWSTVRKSKPEKRASFAPSPIALRNMSSSGTPDSQKSERAKRLKRRSNLRQSTTAQDSPCSQPRNSMSTTVQAELVNSHGQSGHSVSPSKHVSTISVQHKSPTPQGDSTTLVVKSVHVEAPLDTELNTTLSDLSDKGRSPSFKGYTTSFLREEDQSLDETLAGLASEVLAGAPWASFSQSA